jgi:hypothetical protein
MNHTRQIKQRALLLVVAIVVLGVASSRMRADTGTCNGASITLPFTDVPASNGFFCAIAAAYFAGLTNGTTATTYNPTGNVTREQMAAFISRTLDQSLKRGNRRAVAQQWWQPANGSALRSISFGGGSPDLRKIAWDGDNVWVASNGGSVKRVRASDSFVVASYPDFSIADFFNPHDVIVAAGYVFVTSTHGAAPGRVFRIDPQLPSNVSGSVTVFADNTGPNPTGLTFDGQRLWTANTMGGGSITAIFFATAFETTYTDGFTLPVDILWDGENLWVADQGSDQVKRIDPTNGALLQSYAVGDGPSELLFDGANLWVSNTLSNSVTVMRAVGALRGTVLDTITGNGLAAPTGLAFDGERVLVTNNTGFGSVSLFKATDFTPLGNLFTAINSDPFAACSDGLNFWIVRRGLGDIVRF